MKKIQYLLIPALLFAIACQGESGNDQAEKSITGKITYLTGEVTVNDSPAKNGDTVAQNDRISTQDGAKIDIQLSNGTAIRLKDKAELVIANLDQTVKFNLKSGKLFSHIEPGKADGFEIETPTAVASVRGTKFLIEQTAENKAYVCVCEGTVEVKKPGEDAFKNVGVDEDLWVDPEGELEDPVENPMMSKMTTAEFEDMGFEVNK